MRHHGDVDAAPGLLDFAVNVRGGQPPVWLRERLIAALDGLGRDPSAAQDAASRAAVAARHDRDAAAKAVQHQSLLRLGKSDFPRAAR
ncbi:MAG: hypothetical protein ACRDQI_16340, partial [Pseudonocardiaceae bacterium]